MVPILVPGTNIDTKYKNFVKIKNVTWWMRGELEGAVWVERVEQSWGRYGTLHVKVIVTNGALVA